MDGTPNTVQEIADALAEFNREHEGFVAEVLIGAHGLFVTVAESCDDGSWNETKIGVSFEAWAKADTDLLALNLDNMAAKMMEAVKRKPRKMPPRGARWN